MGREDWYRNMDWDEDIAEAFFTKLKRARRKEQYLRIQACYLSKRHPEVALDLLDKYFELEDDFDHAQAYCDMASSYLTLNKVSDALEAYKKALNQESTGKGVKTEAYILLPMLIAEQNIKEQYQFGIDLLIKYKKRLLFPVDHFRWHAAMAIFKYGLGNQTDASSEAEQALDAAQIKKSGFRYHQDIGLVGNQYSDMIKTLCELHAKKQ